MTVALDEATRPVVNTVGVGLVFFLIALNELVVRQSAAYLVPSGHFHVALGAAFLGALVGGFAGYRLERPRRSLGVLLLALASWCPLSLSAFVGAFETPWAWPFVPCAVTLVSAALLAATCTSVVRAFGPAFADLALVERLVTPRALLWGLLLLLACSALLAQLGLLRASFVLGVLLAFAAFRIEQALALVWGVRTPGDELRSFAALGAALACALGLWNASSVALPNDVAGHTATVVYAASDDRDRVVVTSAQSAFSVFVNGALRWSGLDQNRYAHALASPALLLHAESTRCLVLGGSDGLLVARLLESRRCSTITVVTPEALVVAGSSRLWPLVIGSRNALTSSTVEVLNAEPLPWLDARPANAPRFGRAFVDLPDPTNAVSGKNYTQLFYERLARALAPNGVLALGVAPLFHAPRVFGNVRRTVEAAGFHTVPYEAELPALGLWGFLLAAPRDGQVASLLSSSDAARHFLGAPWLRPLSRDATPPASPDDAPTRLYDLRVVELMNETLEPAP